MALFMIQASYTPQAWAAMAKNPENREQALKTLCEKAGGKCHNLYFAFGEHDVIGIIEAPDAKTMAAISIAANSAGHLRACATTPLMTSTEGMEMMKKAGSLGYQAPKG
jgi:uncharacterized protein with GYD domain